MDTKPSRVPYTVLMKEIPWSTDSSVRLRPGTCSTYSCRFVSEYTKGRDHFHSKEDHPCIRDVVDIENPSPWQS